MANEKPTRLELDIVLIEKTLLAMKQTDATVALLHIVDHQYEEHATLRP